MRRGLQGESRSGLKNNGDEKVKHKVPRLRASVRFALRRTPLGMTTGLNQAFCEGKVIPQKFCVFSS